MKYIDVHTHLHDKAFDADRDQVLLGMEQEGVCAITVGTGLYESRKAVELADKHESLFATVGLHPVDNVLEAFDREAFASLARHEKVVAIGECGLDYYYLQNFFEKEREEKGVTWNEVEEKERQQRIFRSQIDLAVELDKSLMLHGRPSKGSMDAYEDMLVLLEDAKEKYGEKLRGNAHFFVGSIDIAERFIAIGFTMSFSGVITFAKEYEEVVRFIPLEMMHAETDSPYASPVPMRGKRNTSLNVQYVVQKIAEIRDVSEEEVRQQLRENAQRVFGLTF